MERSCTIIRIIFLVYALFDLAEQECGLSDWRYVLRTALLCAPILSVITHLWIIWNIWEAAVAVQSAQTVTIIRYYFTLSHDYCYYSIIYSIIIRL